MELISTKICKTGDIGVNDNLFGGTMLSWMDEAGGSYASAKCCTPNMITLKIDEVIFKKPIKVKQHIKIYGEILEVGRTSIKLRIEAKRVNFSDAAEESVCSTDMLFVKIDEWGNAVPIEQSVRVKLLKQTKS